jgi:hypothetical protein
VNLTQLEQIKTGLKHGRYDLSKAWGLAGKVSKLPRAYM